MNQSAIAYISIGSNIDPRANLEEAVRLLASRATISGLSTVYRTPPEGTAIPQEDYLNCVVAIRTELAVDAVRPALLGPIENQLGRVRSEDPYAPRTIDLDLIGWECPGRPAWLHDRKVRDLHVRVPLAELAPHLAPRASLPESYQAVDDLSDRIRHLARGGAM